MPLWGTDARIHVKVLVLSVIFLQFVLPLLPALWNALMRSPLGADSDSHAECTYKCSECTDTPLASKLFHVDFLANLPFRSQFFFYQVDNDAHTCQRRSDTHTGQYMTRDRCLAELQIRDSDSCHSAALTRLGPLLWQCYGAVCRPTWCFEDFPISVWIMSHQKRQLQDACQYDNNSVKLHAKKIQSQLWQLSDAGDGEVFIRSWRGRHLQDMSGSLVLSTSTSREAKWKLADAGEGMIFITSYHGHRLQDNQGHMKLVSGEKNEPSERWDISHPDVDLDSQWELGFNTPATSTSTTTAGTSTAPTSTSTTTTMWWWGMLQQVVQLLPRIPGSPAIHSVRDIYADGVISLPKTMEALSQLEFVRPMTLTYEIRIAADEPATSGAYGYIQIFGSEDCRHCGYSLGVGDGHLWIGQRKVTWDSPDIRKWVRVKIMLTHDKVSFFVHGREHASFTDNKYDHGAIALGSLLYHHNQSRFQYRNVVVETPDRRMGVVAVPLLHSLWEVDGKSVQKTSEVVWGSDGCTLQFVNAVGDSQFSGLKLCFVMDQLPTQLLAMILALMTAWSISRSTSQAEPRSNEDEDYLRMLVRTGAQRMAMHGALGPVRTAFALVFRWQQVCCSLCCFFAVSLIMRPKATIPAAMAICFPLLLIYGAELVPKPTIVLAPPDLNLFTNTRLSAKARFHAHYSTIVQVAVSVWLASGDYLNTQHYTPLGTSFDNHLAWISLTSQGGSAIHFIMGWQKAFSVMLAFNVITMTMRIFVEVSPFRLGLCRAVQLYASFFFLGPFLMFERLCWCVLAPLLHCLGLEPIARMRQGATGFRFSRCMRSWLSPPQTDDEMFAVVEKLVKEIEDASVQRLLQAKECETGTLLGSHLLAAQTQEIAPFPKEVEPAALIEWKCKWVPTPGTLLTDFILFLGDVFTDTWSWSTFLWKGHTVFAGCLATVAWASTLIQLRAGMFEQFFADAVESLAAGVPTTHWIKVLDTEKGLESMLAFVLQGYAYFFAGLEPDDIWLTHASIGLSSMGIATYVQDNYDLKLPEETDSKETSSEETSSEETSSEETSSEVENTFSVMLEVFMQLFEILGAFAGYFGFVYFCLDLVVPTCFAAIAFWLLSDIFASAADGERAVRVQ